MTANKKHIIVDIETNGTVCPIYNMVQLGAVYHEEPTETFFGTFRPLNGNFQQEAYDYTGITHDEVMAYPDAEDEIHRFYDWVKSIKGRDRVIFVSDTTSFDFSFVNYYLWVFCGDNPFGHAPLSLTNLYKGLTGNLGANIYGLRKTKHDHNALNDAIGNHEAFLQIQKMLNERRSGK